MWDQLPFIVLIKTVPRLQSKRECPTMAITGVKTALPFLRIHRESEISDISGTCSYLGVYGTHQSPSSAYLQESRRGWFDCGQLWKWLCVLWSRIADPARSDPHPQHSLRFPTGDISGPSVAKVSQEGKTRIQGATNNIRAPRRAT